MRRPLVESAWHYARASEKRKAPPSAEVALAVESHAARGVARPVRQRRKMRERGKRPCVANCATARELACWVWAVGRMVEGTMQARLTYRHHPAGSSLSDWPLGAIPVAALGTAKAATPVPRLFASIEGDAPSRSNEL